MFARYEPPGSSRANMGDDLTDDSVRETAITKRLSRLRRQLGASAFGGMISEMLIRASMSHGVSKGTNMLLFFVLAAVIYFPMKRKISDGDTSSFAWQGRSPWLMIYWPFALLLIVALQLRFITDS